MAKQTNKKKKNNNQSRNNSEDIIMGLNNKKKKVSASQQRKKDKKKNETYHKVVLAVVKWVILIAILIGAVLFFLSTPLFNISKITIVNNNKISSDTIQELSGIQIGENIYQLSQKQIEENIKQNPYIEGVEIKRKLPSEIEISVKERQATYVLEVGNGFMSINNQGYMLEIEETPDGLPIITGFSTKIENIIEGQRLNDEDLSRLETVLRIMDSININGITEKVSSIDISNKQDYKLTFPEESKVAYLGDASDMSTRVIFLKAMLQREKGISGEIFVNGDTRKK